MYSQTEAFKKYKKALNYFNKGDIVNSIKYLEKCFRLEIYYLLEFLNDKRFKSLRNSEEFKDLYTPSKVFVVNEYISLKLILLKTIIFIQDSLFLTCQKLALNIVPSEFEKYDDFNNIDDILDFQKKNKFPKKEISITPEEEFWAHCSNMQAWAQNNYDTRVLTRYLSFPILAELSKRGIPHFQTLLKEEIIFRIEKGGIKTLRFFIEMTDENYLTYLTEEDLFDNLLPLEEAEIIKSITKFIPLKYTLTTCLKDSREYTSLRDDNKMHFCIEENHIIELEILIDNKHYSDQYHNALLQIKKFKHLEELAIYHSYNINQSSNKIFLKALHNFNNLQNELLHFYEHLYFID